MKGAAALVGAVRNRLQTRTELLRGLVLRVWGVGRVIGGENLQVGPNVTLVLYGPLRLGPGVTLGAGCRLEVGPGAELSLGRGCHVGVGSVVAAQSNVVLEDHVLVAEHVSIRDHDHHVEMNARLNETEAVVADVRVESGCWIGAGARVLKGARLGQGVVVAANSVVRGEVPAHTTVAGIPARVVRQHADT